jgi:hypothetical protein
MRRAGVATVCVLGLLGSASARADGGPVPATLGGAGVSTAGSPYSFVAVGAGRNTVVERVRRAGATVEGSVLVNGSFGVPGATYDGSDTGLSANGRTLVLTSLGDPYFPRRTHLLVLNTASLRARARIRLPGYFTVDAISPTGQWLYLIHYKSPRNINIYEVRALDLRDGRLLRKPIVDPRESDEKMLGLPMTRAIGAGGRWVYTLYYRGDQPPFIHALDTSARAAFCVDLPARLGADVTGLRLVLSSPTTLRIELRNSTLAVMNTRTFAVRAPEAAIPRGHGAGRSQDGLPWALAIPPLAALIAFAFIARRRPARAGR